MRKYLMYGSISLILVCIIGFQALNSWTFQLDLGADNVLIPSNSTLRDVATNPEAYLNRTVTIEGYAQYLRCLSESRCITTVGDFLLVESVEDPGAIWIWVYVLDKAHPLPPSNSKVLIKGEVVFVKDQGGLYRIVAQEMEILEEPKVPQHPQLELFTDKFAYELGKEVILTFANREPEGMVVQLPNGVPFEIEYRDIETGKLIVYSLPTIEVLIDVPGGESITWTLREPEGLMGPGYYQIAFRTYVGEELETLYTSFTVGVLPTSSELFTDKTVYSERENITLIYVNRDSHTANAGYCFEISYRVQETGSSTTYGLPCIEILVIVPPGGNITWTLTPTDLRGPGYYTISYRIYRGEQVETLHTEFTILPKESPVSTPFFVPSFGAIVTIMAMLAILLLRTRIKV
ncbi:MAG: hypothetical protein ACE5R6_19440 [Candidatus Heimdallarchaeota archaeon]